MKPLVALLTIMFLPAASVLTGLVKPSYIEARPQAVVASTAFEVASIKPTKLLGGVKEACHGINSKFRPGDAAAGVPLGRCVVSSGRLSHMIGLAYGVSMDMLKGGPAWVATGEDRFDVEAKVEDPTTATQEQLLTMFQALLADRFKLKFHRETRETQGFALVVARNGPKLREAASAEDRRIVLGVAGTEESAAIKKAVEDTAKERTSGGPLMALTGQRISMADLAVALRPFAGGEVVNETKLNGFYDFKLTWESGQVLSTPLQEQLGLRLEARKIPVDFFIIDSAEKPTGN